MKNLKSTLLNIVKLPKRDQRWLLKQLSVAQKTLWKNLEGQALLHQASRFRRVGIDHVTQPLPAYYENLMQQSLLFIAIILTQTNENGLQHFLQQHPQKEALLQKMQKVKTEIKPATLQICFEHWEKEFLETRHDSHI